MHTRSHLGPLLQVELPRHVGVGAPDGRRDVVDRAVAVALGRELGALAEPVLDEQLVRDLEGGEGAAPPAFSGWLLGFMKSWMSA
jgi:hypothetical protein